MIEPSFEVAGRPTQMLDWQADADAEGGDRTFTGRVPAGSAWAEQGAPLVAWLPGMRALWSGELVLDPIEDGSTWEIRAEGRYRELERVRTPLLYRLDGADLFVDGESDPHAYGSSDKYSQEQSPGALIWRLGDGAGTTAYAAGDQAVYVLQLPGVDITAYSVLVEISATNPNFDLRTQYDTGPNTSPVNIADHPLTAASATRTGTVPASADTLLFRVRANAAASPVRRRVKVSSIKIYGRTQDDGFTASDAAADIAALANMGATLTDSTLRVLPLYWTEGAPELLSYLAELNGWRWLVRHEGLEFGPYERTWDVSIDRGASGILEPARLANRYVVPYRTLADERHEAVGVAPDVIDPFPGVDVFEAGEELEDPQPNADLAAAVAEIGAAFHATRRISGSLELRAVQSRGAPRSPYDVYAGDQVRITELGDLGPQRVSAVSYRPRGAVTVEIGETFNPLRLIARFERRHPKRPRKRRKGRR